MIDLIKKDGRNTDNRAPRRTALFVLFALLVNLIGVHGALAGLPTLTDVGSTQLSKSAIQSRQQSVKPCHHNHVRSGAHKIIAQSGPSLNTVPDDDLCCTNDGRTGELQAALRTKRDPVWQALNNSPDIFFAHAFHDTSAQGTFYVDRGEPSRAQLIGLIGATAQFVHTVRLLN